MVGGFAASPLFVHERFKSVNCVLIPLCGSIDSDYAIKYNIIALPAYNIEKWCDQL
jgi:hypothetical protein